MSLTDPLPLKTLHALLVCTALATIGLGQAARAEDRVELSFYTQQGNQLLYRGLRVWKTEGGRITETSTYTTPAGKPIQKAVAVFRKSDLTPISFRLNDFRSGQMEEMRKDGNRIFLSSREEKGEDSDSDTIDWEPGSLISATVVPKIKREWERLMKGNKVAFQLLVPSRQEAISFRVQVDRELTPPDKSRVVIRMDPDSWVIRQLVDPLFFTFEPAAQHRLLEFSGRVSIKTDDGDDQDLRITYHYLREGG